jgi:hypothetical protein
MTVRTKKQDSGRWLQVAQWMIPLLLSALVSYGTAQFRSGSAEAATTLKITNLETRYSALDQNVVPRKETEAHWVALEDFQRSILTDLRELRASQEKILLRLTMPAK